MEIVRLGSAGSTNSEAQRLWKERGGVAGGLVVVAEEQSSGVGRTGRVWKSPRGGLWLTVAWPLAGLESCMGALPLAAGLAVAEAIEHLGLSTQIKWPNDVLVFDRKVAGILCQSLPGGPHPFALIGVGINANFPSEQLGDGLRHPPISLLDALDAEVDLEVLLQDVLARLAQRLSEGAKGGVPLLIPPIEQRLAWRGEWVCAQPTATGADVVTGTLAGLAPDGQIRILTEEGERQFASAELLHLSSES